MRRTVLFVCALFVLGIFSACSGTDSGVGPDLTPETGSGEVDSTPDVPEGETPPREMPGPYCGDGACLPDEDCGGCPEDCGVCCGNGTCDSDLGEECIDCPEDCGDCCGDGLCDPEVLETCSSCPWDCGDCCGDGTCDTLAGESCLSCTVDCGACCGNGTCTPGHGEDCQTCTEDCGECGPECGDGTVDWELNEQCDDGNLEAGDGCDGGCQVEPAPAAPGDLVITEIMADPKAVYDLNGEWFEVYNATDKDINLNGWHLLDQALDFHEIFSLGGVVVPAGSYFVLAWEEGPDVNGGVTPDYVYRDFQLFNDSDTIILRSGDTIVDQVSYDEAFPRICGTAMNLAPDALDFLLNDAAENWCPSTNLLESGDCGSAGAVNPECVVVFCGDGNLDDGEGCDDGNLEDGDGCSSNCQPEPECGNGILEGGEHCDDGNVVPGDGCNADCHIESEDPVCGNGIVEGPGAGWPEGEATPGTEWCDDGNKVDGDGCSANCQLEDVKPWQCGNGVVEAANDEICDDGNTVDGDGCNKFCKLECNGVCEPCGQCCGDGYTTAGEMCDDGNLTDADGCSATCQTEQSMTRISGTVHFEGKHLPGDLVYIVAHKLPSWDPTGAEVLPGGAAGALELPAQFPMEYELTVGPGYHWVTVILNLGGELMAGIGEEDIWMTFSKGKAPTAIELTLGEHVQGIDFVLPEDGSAATSSASGTITYAGNVSPNDALYLVFSGEAPPSVLAVVTIKIKPVQFPYEYYAPYLVPWAYYIVGVLDKGDNAPTLDFTEPWGAYPSGESPKIVTVGQEQTLVGYDFELVEPPQQ